MSRALAIVAVLAGGASADDNQCRILDVDFATDTIADQTANMYAPQIVAWIEDATGAYVDTIYITQATGSFGIGNRPGRFELNSGPNWPYGRRTTTFPIWAHKQPLRWQKLLFQDSRDNELSHSSGQSSLEHHFCRPTEGLELDTMTCPSALVHTDKGKPSPTDVIEYPPRNDIVRSGEDVDEVDMFGAMNPFDAISMPTPPPGTDAAVSYAVPQELPFGDYVLWVEVSRELDKNDVYNDDMFPPIPTTFRSYGKPYRGQPSVVYKVPFTIAVTESIATTIDYAGYGDPTGGDGAIRPPDSTISTDPGSGGARLAIGSADGTMYRVRIKSRRELDSTPPAAIGGANVADATSHSATITFTAPGDDGMTGMVKSYEIRYRVGDAITDDNFADAPLLTPTATLVSSGELQTITFDNLLPETDYSIGIRALDNCNNASPLVRIDVTTADRLSGEVDACFIATAAYGSVMAEDVGALRHFRDALLRKSVLGELAVEAYYTFGPAFAGVVGESDLLRATARDLLAPIVAQVR